MFFTIFSPSSFIILLSVFRCCCSCCCPVYFGWNYSFWWDTWRRGGRVGNGGQCGSQSWGNGGPTRRRFGHERSCVCKRINFFCEYGGKSTCLLGRRRGRTGRCVHVCVCMGVCEWRTIERGVNEHKQGRRSSICCCLCNSMFHAFKHGQRLSACACACVCVSACHMRLFIYTHTRTQAHTQTRGNYSWQWQRESCRAKAPSGRVYLALTLDILLNFAFAVHCKKLKAQVKII